MFYELEDVRILKVLWAKFPRLNVRRCQNTEACAFHGMIMKLERSCRTFIA